MQIVFDRGLETQNAVTISFFGENISRNTLNATLSKVLSAEEYSVTVILGKK